MFTINQIIIYITLCVHRLASFAFVVPNFSKPETTSSFPLTTKSIESYMYLSCITVMQLFYVMLVCMFVCQKYFESIQNKYRILKKLYIHVNWRKWNFVRCLVWIFCILRFSIYYSYMKGRLSWDFFFNK